MFYDLLHKIFAHRYPVILGSLLIIIVGVTQCGDPVSSGSGTLRVRITDAPFPYNFVRAVNVTISKIEIRPVGSSGFQTVERVEQTFNLIDLQDGRTDTLGTRQLAVGEYDATRLIVTDVSIELRDGRVLAPAISDSIQANGLVSLMVSPAQILDNQLTELVIDFDLPRSLIAEGDISASAGITDFIFTPTVRSVNLVTAGQITGLIKHDNRTPAEPIDDIPMRGLQLSLVQVGTSDTVSVVTDDMGEYNAFFLPAGAYSITTVPTDSTSALSIPDVIVTTANPTRQDALMDRQ